MIPHHVYYQLAVIGFLWLCIMLHYTWPSRSAVSPQLPTEPVPTKFKRKRTSEPTPFEGLTQRPPCAACEHDAHHPKPSAPRRPDPMPATSRRPCTVDTSMHFCPHDGCDYRGWLGLGNLRANGHPSGGPWRQFYCRSCQGYFLETHGTIFHGKRLSVELIVRVLACLAEGLALQRHLIALLKFAPVESRFCSCKRRGKTTFDTPINPCARSACSRSVAVGLGIRATARVFEVDANTVLQWLVEAAEQLRAFTRYFLCDVHVTQLQLDELYAVLRGVRDGQISEEQALRLLEPARPWVWTAIDPVSKLLLAIEVGPRTVAMAQRVVHQVVGVLAPGCMPAWFSDGFKGYLPAILGHFGVWTHPERRQDQGPRPKPRWRPLPQLLYAQVVKQYRRKRVVGAHHRVVFGTLEAIEHVLAVCGWKINTSFIERLNLDIRQRVAAVGRRVNTLCQGEAGLQHQLALFHVYYNWSCTPGLRIMFGDLSRPVCTVSISRLAAPAKYEAE